MSVDDAQVDLELSNLYAVMSDDELIAAVGDKPKVSEALRALLAKAIRDTDCWEALDDLKSAAYYELLQLAEANVIKQQKVA